MNSTQLVAFAREVARIAHAGQLRRNGDPFLLHPFGVAILVSSNVPSVDSETIAAALLHDVLEDTSHTIDGFPDKTQCIVGLLTKSPGQNDMDVLRRLQLAPVEAILVRIADRYDNLSSRFSVFDALYREKPRVIESTVGILSLAESRGLSGSSLFRSLHELARSMGYVSR
ncbi:MAG: hypothetical protein DIJKHBIC_00826 [Thermoanaerobaculia bacterium]|nr:hypothetical protein [Thermoanaerobaculia bacterium]